MPKANLGGALNAAKRLKTGQSTGKVTRSTMALTNIRDRPHGDTRPLNDEHVLELLESILAVGLIQPLAVDSQGHLLAGGHRREAIHLLSSLSQGEREGEESEEFYREAWTKHFNKGIPVRIFEFNAASDAEQALAIEAAENEKRRDYTPSEVRDLADRLMAAGYQDRTGNQKGHNKKLTPALMTIVGKSRRTIKSYLAKEEETTKSPALSTARSRAQKTLQQLMEHPDLQGKGWKQNHKAYLQSVIDDLEFIGSSDEHFTIESAIKENQS